ncbi:MAG: ABC transporter permease [Candidatus Latescibacterota bacterium]|jgi:putative ABC transport system permease protein
MLWQHLKLTFRLLGRHRLESALTIAGLAVGLAGFLLSLGFVDYWWQCDGFHANADRIHAVWTESRWGEVAQRSAALDYRLEGALRGGVPGVEATVKTTKHHPTVVAGDERTSAGLLVVDPGFFETFTFPLARGDASRALADPRSVVLTQEVAHRYFGDADPLGQPLDLEFTGYRPMADGAPPPRPGSPSAELDEPAERLTFTVTGVLGPARGATVLEFGMLASRVGNERLRNRGTSVTYLRLDRAADPGAVAKQLDRLSATWYGRVTAHLVPLREVLWTSGVFGLPGHGDQLRLTGYGLLALSGLVLFIACGNFVNLAVARATTRAAEVGIRQTVGAGRGQLGRQFLTESVVVTTLSMVLGLAAAEVFHQHLSGAARYLLGFNPLAPRLLALAVLLAGVVGVLAGAYPALVVSRFAPVRALAAQHRIGGRSWLSRATILLQFAVSTFLLVIALVVPAQVAHLRQRSMGYEPSGLLMGYYLRGRLDDDGLEALRQHLAPGGPVLSLAAASPGPSFEGEAVSWRRGPDPVPVACYWVSRGFIETVKLRLVAGRDFDPAIGTDATEAVIVNQAMAQAIGPEPLGAQLEGIRRNGPMQVIGVVADFDQGNVHVSPRPCLLRLVGPAAAAAKGPAVGAKDYYHLLARVAPGEAVQGRADLLRAWEAVFPGRTLELGALDQMIADRFGVEETIGLGLTLAAACALGVAALGLLSLVILAVGQRTREVGIRKALGATPQSLVLLLSSDLARLVLLGNLLAWPAAYWAASQWLSGYAYRVPLGPGLFLLAGGAVLVVALLTVASHTLRAALANPVEALRYE